MFSSNAAEALFAIAQRLPDKDAIVTKEGATTWSALRDRAAAFAKSVVDHGVGVGERVAIFVDRGADAASAFYGVLASGAVAVQVNPTLKPSQIEHILSHSGARVLFAESMLLERLHRPLDAKVTTIDIASIGKSATFTPHPRIATDVAHIIYTSGSTGLPKGVTISHGNLHAGAESVSTYLGLRETDRIASLLPFSFDYGLNQLLCCVRIGATLVVETSPIAARVVKTLNEQRVTVLAGVPPLYLQLIEAAGFQQPIPTLRVMTNSGGRVPVPIVKRLREAQPQAQLFLMYGLTEAFRSTYLPPDLTDRHPDSIGRAIPGAEIMVLRPDGTECDPEEEGELVHRGPTVAIGYWNDPEATARVYRENPRRPAGTPSTERVVFSGDTVKRDANGLLYFVARHDKMIKTMGYRVSPDEVVEGLMRSGHVSEAIVLAEADEEAGAKIIAHVALRETGKLEDLETFCRAELPRYMQPARIVVHTALPRTSSGKHDPTALVGSKG